MSQYAVWNEKTHGWEIINKLGHIQYLDVPNPPSVVDIGLLGTRCLHEIPVKPNKTTAMGRMLDELNRPLYLIDTRRDGTGAQSSWSPREFATIIPAMVRKPMEFLHLPAAAPSISQGKFPATCGVVFKDFCLKIAMSRYRMLSIYPVRLRRGC